MKLERFQQLVDNAMPGPWVAHNSYISGEGRDECIVAWECYGADAQFIAACRDMVPKLLEVARAAQVGAFHHNCCPWLEGKECCCAKQLVDSALAAMEADA